MWNALRKMDHTVKMDVHTVARHINGWDLCYARRMLAITLYI